MWIVYFRNLLSSREEIRKWLQDAARSVFVLHGCTLCMLTESCCSVMSKSLQPHALQPTRLLCPQDSPGKNTGVGCRFLLQRIFPTQGLNPGLPHCRQMLYHLSHLFVSHLSNPRNGPSVVCCEAVFSFLSSFINAVGQVGKHAS